MQKQRLKSNKMMENYVVSQNLDSNLSIAKWNYTLCYAADTISTEIQSFFLWIFAALKKMVWQDFLKVCKKPLQENNWINDIYIFKL